MRLSAILQALVATGATPAMLVAAVEAAERDGATEIEARRKGDAERKRRQRQRDRDAWEDMSRDSHETSADAADLSAPPNGPPSPEPPTPPLTPPPPVPPKPPGELFEEDVVVSDYPRQAFDAWYRAYPHKVGRLKAKASFERVRKGRIATFAELVDGLARYVREKPLDTPWANPATWLNQGRWSDERGDLASAPGSGPDPVLARLKELTHGQP